MTPQEKLKEIKECVSDRSGDREWLINRVKVLTEALEKIKSEAEDNLIAAIADDALEPKIIVTSGDRPGGA